MIRAVIIAALVLGTLDVARAQTATPDDPAKDVRVWTLMARAPGSNVQVYGGYTVEAKCERARTMLAPALKKQRWGVPACIPLVAQ